MNPMIKHLMQSKQVEKKEADQSEAVRIANLNSYIAPVHDWTSSLKTENGTMQLREVQNKALSIASDTHGLLGLIGCGHGKTLISLLIPQVMKKKSLYSYSLPL